MLQGKKILIAGGNGFVGNFIASKFIQQKANVFVLSRRGPKYNYPENKHLNWLIGDIMESQKYQNQINQADTVIHAMGTLFDTSITKNRNPGQPGTYQHMNRDTLISLLNVLKSKKQVIFMSSVGHPPFIHRYQKTKEQAQQILSQSGHKSHIIKAGFIHNWDHRKWSTPLRHTIEVWNKIYPSIYKIAPNETYLQKFLKQFQQSEPTPLEIIAASMIKLIQQGQGPQYLFNKQMKQFFQVFQKQIAKQKY